ncbi:glutamic acid-rich protein [Trifolium repens]|nr:glutamic acid-rich protein [Trifolium repens]
MYKLFSVASKLSKRKVDDSLHMLHSILFGKKTKAHNLNRNIGQFSDYVWAENECSLIFYYLIMCVQQPTSAPAAVAASVGESGLLDKDQKRDKDTGIGMDC